MGEIVIPTGNIMVRDPLVYLHQEELPYFIKVPTGKFPLTTLVVEVDEGHHRYVATRVKFTENKAVSYTEALIGNEDINSLNSGEYFGFNVDAGLATIVDTETRDLYCNFVDQWEKKILKVISTIISSHKNSRKAMKKSGIPENRRGLDQFQNTGY